MEVIMDINDMYLRCMTTKEISIETGIPISTVRRRLLKSGILRTPSEAQQLASQKGRLGSGNRGKKRVFTDEWLKNLRKGIIEYHARNAKGWRLKASGYIVITLGVNKDRHQHTVIMEEHIKRRLEPNECVHHINEIKHDNRLENLQLMTKGEHMRHHALIKNKHRQRDEKGRYI